MINNICDHCLVVGYADQVRRIDRKVADEAIRYFAKPSGRSRRGQGRSAAVHSCGYPAPGPPRRPPCWPCPREIGHVLGSYSTHLMDWARSMRDMVSR